MGHAYAYLHGAKEHASPTSEKDIKNIYNSKVGNQNKINK
jgi:hypothetical protein